jgi:tryptophan synthase alpha chain
VIALEQHLRARRDDGRKLLVPYVTGGVTGDWTDYLLALQDAGADAIEIGLPFSDPMLDGRTVQEASDQALGRGTTIDGILADLARIAARVTVPLVTMTYTNPVVRRGGHAYCAALVDAGVSGTILPDLPVHEADEMVEVCAAAGVDLVLLAAPSTGPERLRRICERSRGFLYAVTVMGTTGERRDLSPHASRLAADVQEICDLPVLLGFGISDADQARAAVAVADGVVVASALMRRVLDGAGPAAVGAFAAELRKHLDLES